MKILAVGGGSGGHVSPIVPVLEEVHKALSDDESLEVTFVCDKHFEAQSRALMTQLAIPVTVRVIAAGKLRRYKHFKLIDYITTPSVTVANLLDLGRIVTGFFQSLWLLIRWRPNVVFAKGGYVCLPLGLAAWILHIPLSIHDSDARPGLTNRILGRFAQAIATGYPLDNYSYPSDRSAYTGVPIRAEFAPVSDSRQRVYKRKLGFDEMKPLVVAVGGGLGSVSINRAMIAAAPSLINQGAQALVVAGKANYKLCKDEAEPYVPHIKIIDFVPGLHEILAAADIVVTRASATSLQELAGLKKAIVTIPAKALSDQHKNAAVYQEAMAALTLTDDELAEGRLAGMLGELLANPQQASNLATNLHKFARPDAAKDMARIILKAAS